MAAVFRSGDDLNQALISQPWQPFSIDEQKYLVKAIFDDNVLCHEFCISDFKNIWHEKVDEAKFKTLSQELNPNVEADILYLMKHVYKNVESQQANTNYQIVKSDNGKLQLKFKSKLKPGVPYVWCFNCQGSGEEVVSRMLIEPLVGMVAELLRRQNELQSLLMKKDLEIADYKQSEVQLSRKSLETKKFDAETFNKKMSSSAVFGHTVAKATQLAFTKQAQDLYQQVLEKKKWLEGADIQDIPLDGIDSSPSVSPYTSPQKTAPKPTAIEPQLQDESPSKERELQRREELRRKLDEEAERKKRKKKKIKL